MPEWLGLNSATCAVRDLLRHCPTGQLQTFTFFYLIHSTVLLVHKDCPSDGVASLALLEPAAAAAAITAVVRCAQLPWERLLSMSQHAPQ